MPDPTGELLSVMGYLQWLPRAKKRFAPQKNTGSMQWRQVSSQNSGSVNGGTKRSSIIKKSLAKQCSFFFFFYTRQQRQTKLHPDYAADLSSSQLCVWSEWYQQVGLFWTPFFNEFNKEAVELVWVSRRAFWRCSKTPHLIQQIELCEAAGASPRTWGCTYR